MSLAILNVGAGDTKLSFDPKNAAERIRAARIVRDMLRRGYALLVQVGAEDGGAAMRMTATPMADRIPVETVADLETLDEAEITEGYFDGRANEPEPGDNRSRAYWHGWRVGMMDGGHMPIDPPHRRLVRDVVRTGYLRTLAVPR